MEVGSRFPEMDLLCSGRKANPFLCKGNARKFTFIILQIQILQVVSYISIAGTSGW